MSTITIEEKEFIAASELAKASAMKTKDAALAAYFFNIRKSLADARTKSMENIARNQKRKSNIHADVKKRKKTIGNHWP